MGIPAESETIVRNSHDDGLHLFSNLPDDIISDIVSRFLLTFTQKQSIQLGLSSSKAILNRVIKKRLALIFDGSQYEEDRYEEELNRLRDKLRGYAEDNSNLETFTFKTLAYDPAFVRRVEKNCYECIDLSTKLSPKNLKLTLNLNLTETMVAEDEYNTVNLPKSVYEVESLVQLSLNGWALQHPARIEWSNLKRLCLDSVYMKFSFFEHIFRSCPMIENLKILNCCPHVPYFKFRVSNLYNLKQFAIRLRYPTQVFELKSAPNLESIACSYESPTFNYIGVAERDLMTHILNLGQFEYQNLKVLSLDYFHCVGRNFNLFFDILASEFPLLEELSVNTDQNLLRFKLSSPSLKKIRLVNMRTLKKAVFDVPNIVHFEFECYHNKTFAELDTSAYPKFAFKGNPNGWTSQITLGSHPGLQWRSDCGARWFWPTK